jgi:hypothetical protein
MNSDLEMDEVAQQEAKDNDLRDSTIIDKYANAAEIANYVADWIKEQLSTKGIGMRIVELCSSADRLIEQEVRKRKLRRSGDIFDSYSDNTNQQQTVIPYIDVCVHRFFTFFLSFSV